MENYKQGNNVSIYAWLGFGISLFLIVLSVLAIVLLSFNSNSERLGVISVMPIFLGIPFILLTFIFSIVGLNQSIKNNSPKWVGVCGIIFSVLYLPIYLMTYFIVMDDDKRSIDEITYSEQIIDDPASVGVTKDDVVVEISMFYAFFYDNRNGQDQKPSKFSLLDHDFKHQISVWMKVKKIDPKTVSVVIDTKKDVEYSYVVKTIDTLQSLGFQTYKVM